MAPLGLPPLDVLLSWPLPNYVNPITRGSEAYAIGTIFFGFATVALAIRLYARLFIRKWFGLDDFLIVLAWVRTVLLDFRSLSSNGTALHSWCSDFCLYRDDGLWLG